MARTPSITDEQILEAAREVFFECGLKATTAEIADRAGISEGTIFRRFPTKQELFMAAMGVPSGMEWLDTLQEFQDIGGATLRDNLTRLANELLAFFEQLIPKMTMVMASGIDPHTLLTSMEEPPPVRGVKALTNYFHHEQKRGRMRPCDPEIAARMFLGTLQNFAFFEIAELNEFLPMPRQTFIRGIIDNFLRGVESPINE